MTEEVRAKTDREEVLAWAAALVAENNYVVLDTETTGLKGEVISVAVVAPDGSVLGEWLVKPTERITEEAMRVHGITDEMLTDAPGFAEVWPEILRCVLGKTVVIYNAGFDVARLVTSAKRAGIRLGALETRCVMAQFARFYGEWNDYHGDYKWQSLATACSSLGISLSGQHSALGDATAAAAVVRMLARMGEYAERVPEERRGIVVDRVAEALCGSRSLVPMATASLFGLEESEDAQP